MNARPIFGKELATIYAHIAATLSEEQGTNKMAELAALKSGHAQNAFLDQQDLILLRQQADEIDAAYGETLDALLPASLIRLTERSRAA